MVNVRKHLVYAGNDAQSTIFGRFWPVLTVFDVLSYWGSSRGYTRRLPVPVSAGTWPLAGRVKGHAQNTPGLPLAFTRNSMSERQTMCPLSPFIASPACGAPIRYHTLHYHSDQHCISFSTVSFVCIHILCTPSCSIPWLSHSWPFVYMPQLYLHL